ncbi:hypothetical protein CDAR_550961 [Caerostris darwini]|uniref:Uncharacterized protein n=1 Tax=Caerostris darwini TaxID=1538125 RepID=A0AAV4QLP6_9ARAC|nr:hypothetical protein CDAR_550961 [Caerostris darwini]
MPNNENFSSNPTSRKALGMKVWKVYIHHKNVEILLKDTRRRKDDAGKQQKGLSRAMMDCWQEDGRGHGLSDDLCITS